MPKQQQEMSGLRSDAPERPGFAPAKSPVTIADLSLDECLLTDRVQQLRTAYFRACPQICVERPLLITRFHQELGLFHHERIGILDKARVYRRVLETREPVVWHTEAQDRDGEHFTVQDESLFAGSTTSRFKGVVLYPEFLGLALWPELHTMTERAANPYMISPEQARILNEDVFPAWLDRSILERARAEAKESESPPDFTLYQQLVFFLASKPNTISHTIPDFSRALNEGLRAVIGEAQSRGSRATDSTQREFYEAIGEVLEGVIAYSRRLAERAEAMASRETDGRRREELKALARIHGQVPEYPARSFREGLTTIWMCWVALNLENSNNGLSLGRLDQLLYPLFRHDIDSKALTLQDAAELCCLFWLKIGDHVPTVPEAGEQLFGGTGSNQAITIGGVDSEGRDAVTDLTYVMLRAIEMMRLRDPNLNARYMPGVNPPAYLRRLCEANIRTGATPAIHNDRAVIEALTAHGDSVQHARDYGIVGCVEPCSVGRHYGHTAALLLNLTAVLELTLFNGRHRHTGLDRLVSIETGGPAAFTTFEDLRQAFAKQLTWMAELTVRLNNALGRAHQHCYPTPILSALFEGPMESGKDVIEGGALINSSGVAIIGLADTADSLSAIQRLVFEEKALSLGEFLSVLERDFDGAEALRRRLIDPAKTPKWGNEDPTADGNVAWLIRQLDAEYGSRANYRGGHYRVGYWTMTNHAGYGRLMGALPNGRKAHQNFTSGFTPVSGATPYLTATLNSVAAMPARCLAGGVAFNVKFTPVDSSGDPTMLERFTAAVEGYFDAEDAPGGMEIQFNVTSRADFLDAMEHPEKHPELLVRVSGYTAYFKDLNPQMQREVLERTEYELSSGAATRPETWRLP